MTAIDERAIAIAKTSLPVDETFVDGIMVVFINDVGFEQFRLMLLTNCGLYRVKFDWNKWRVVHSRSLPLSSIVDVALGHVAKQTGGQTKGFAVRFRTTDVKTPSSSPTDVRSPTTTTHPSPTSPRLTVYAIGDIGIVDHTRPSAITTTPSSPQQSPSRPSSQFATMPLRRANESDFASGAVYTAVSKPRTSSMSTTMSTTSFQLSQQQSREMEYVYFISDDTDDQERKLERFLKALVALAPNVNAISEKITISGK